MYRRGILAAVVAAIVFASGSTCSAGPVLPGGPLQGDWSCTCTSLIRITVPPFTTTTFHITQIGSVIQGVNAPTGSDPLCALAGTYSSGVIMANTTCGAPRNTTPSGSTARDSTGSAARSSRNAFGIAELASRPSSLTSPRPDVVMPHITTPSPPGFSGRHV